MLNDLLRVSIAVNDLEEAIENYSRMGLSVVGHVQESQRGFGMEWVEMGTEGRPLLELIAPTADDGPIARFLAKRGEGVYQVRLGTSGIDDSLSRMAELGVRVVSDEHHRPGLRKLGWVHPASTNGVLIELVESDRRCRTEPIIADSSELGE